MKYVRFLLRVGNAQRTNTKHAIEKRKLYFLLLAWDLEFSLFPKTTFLPISFETDLFLYKLKLLAMSCATVFFLNWLVIRQNEINYFKMEQKIQTFVRQILVQHSAKGFFWVYHRNAKIIGCVVLTPNAVIQIYSIDNNTFNTSHKKHKNKKSTKKSVGLLFYVLNWLVIKPHWKQEPEVACISHLQSEYSWTLRTQYKICNYFYFFLWFDCIICSLPRCRYLSRHA